MRPLRILLVDDEAAILECVGRLLRGHGHIVNEFLNFSLGTALEIVEAAAAIKFDLALVDAVMPGIDGIELIEYLHRVSPRTRFVSMGCGAFAEAATILTNRGIACQTLLKPFEPKQLEEALEATLSSHERNPKVPVIWAGDEAALRSEVDRVVTTVVCAAQSSAVLSAVGPPGSDTYAGQCKTIADLVWRKLPGPSLRASVSRLADRVALALGIDVKAKACKEIARRLFSALPPEFRGTELRVVRSVRPYPRHCSWCSREITRKEPCLVVYGVAKRRPRFCSEDCLENWDSIFWQELALAHSSLPEKEAQAEMRQLNRQKHLMGYGW